MANLMLKIQVKHIYIPVLPKSLLSFCCAPMPFVVGILASELNEVMMLPMDEVLIINLDDDSFIRVPDPARDDIELLPPHAISLLTRSIRNTQKMIKSNSFSPFNFYIELTNSKSARRR